MEQRRRGRSIMLARSREREARRGGRQALRLSWSRREI